MRFGSVCSGIEAASVAWEPLGFEPAWFSEIAKFPSRVLAHRFPGVPNYGSLVGLADRLTGGDREIDLLVGGTPCQSFSVAGLRGGLADSRGNLALEFARLADALRPSWVLWENVPGVLSSDGGRAFGSILGALVDIGYGVAWRVLDAQYFGVAQRRRRVFLVGCLGGAAAAGAVLFEPEGVRRNPPSRGEAREGAARTAACGVGVGGEDVARCLTTSNQRNDWETETFVTASFDETQVTSRTNRSSCDPSTAALTKSGRPPSIAFSARQDPVHSEDTMGALDTDGSSQAVCITGEVTHALRAVGADASEDGTGRGTPITQVQHRVRRLTPREAERLQGFPDDWTAIPGAKDGPRYAALGNSMAVPCMAWLGRRIQLVDGTLLEADAAKHLRQIRKAGAR